MVFSSPPAAWADLDPKLSTPYELNVVVHFGKNNVFTPVFKEQMQAELREILQESFGTLAQVKVQSAHPLLKEIGQNGLQKAFDGWHELSPAITHFLLVDFVNGSFRLQSRQQDGSTGLASPQVRQETTADPAQLARLASLLVEKDFGLTGTVTAVKGNSVDVALQGGGLLDSAQKWLKTDSVFAVCRIVQAGDKTRAERLEHTLLQIKSAAGKGKYHCQLHTALYGPEKLQEGPGVLGYRCLKLATTQMKLSFQLVAVNSDQPLSGLQIHVSPESFGGKVGLGGIVKLSVDAKGRAQTSKPFDNVAFVRVLSGNSILAEFPVALVNDQPITCRVSANVLAAESQLELRQHQWVKRIMEGLLMAADRNSKLKSELSKSPEQALQLANSGLDSLEAELKSLNLELIALKEDAEKAKITLDLVEGNQGLKELSERKQQLANFIKDVGLFIKQDATTKQLKTMLAQARLLEEQADYDQAIAMYKKVVAERPDEKNVDQYLNKLQSEWTKDRGPEHKKARVFVYESWHENMDTAELKANLPKAKQALALFKQTGDRLTPRKMLKANLFHALNLKKRLEALNQAANTEDNRNEKKTIFRLTEELRDLYNEVRAWVEQKKD